MASRYAVTANWEEDECYNLFGDDCQTEFQEQAARNVSIKKAALAGSASIVWDGSAQWDEPGFLKVTICSNPGKLQLPGGTFEPYTCVDDAGDPFEFAGIPGDYVVIVVDYNHPLLTPILSSMWPQLHLRSH